MHAVPWGHRGDLGRPLPLAVAVLAGSVAAASPLLCLHFAKASWGFQEDLAAPVLRLLLLLLVVVYFLLTLEVTLPWRKALPGAASGREPFFDDPFPFPAPSEPLPRKPRMALMQAVGSLGCSHAEAWAAGSSCSGPPPI